MARILTSPLIASISGTLGGVTFKNSRSGSIASKRYRARRRRSPTQASGAAALSQLAWRWAHVLTDDQRTAWSRAARAGEPPRQAFTSDNAIRLRAGLEPLDAAPPWPYLLPPPALSITWTDPDEIIVAPPGELPADGEAFVLSLLHPWTPSVLAPRTWAKQSWTLEGPITTAHTLSLAAPFYSGLNTHLVARRLNAYSAQEVRTVKFYDEYTPAIGYFNIVDIPDNYTHISIIIVARSINATLNQTSRLFFNGDLVDANYYTSRHRAGAEHDNTFYSYPHWCHLPAANAPAPLWMQAHLTIPFYLSDKRKTAHYRAYYAHADDSPYTYLGNITWKSTAPITSIRLSGAPPDPILHDASRCIAYLHDIVLPAQEGRPSAPAHFPLLWP